MKHQFLLFIALAFCSISFAIAQDYTGSMAVFSEDGDKFTLFINGDQKNGASAERVVAENITEVPFLIRIVFENQTIPELKQKGIRGGRNCVYSIHKNKKGEYALKIKDCTDPFDAPSTQQPTTTTTVTSSPNQLYASYADGIISINDGRTLKVTKVKANGMTYPRLIMAAPVGVNAFISYDDNDEKYSAEVPFKYEVKDYSNNNAYLTLTVDEGGPARTWHIKLQNSNGYDLKID